MRLAGLVSLLAIAACRPVLAQGPPSDGWTPEAQALMEKGAESAAQGDMSAALSRFDEAWRAAGYHFDHRPDRLHPPLLFDLGLAHARAGHPAAAWAWLSAYLAAEPGAANRDACEAEIAKQRDAATSRVARMLDQLQVQAAEVAGATAGSAWPWVEWNVLVGDRARAGDLVGARRLADNGSARWRALVAREAPSQGAMAATYVEYMESRIGRAREQAEYEALYHHGVALLRAGDFEAGTRTLAQIRTLPGRESDDSWGILFGDSGVAAYYTAPELLCMAPRAASSIRNEATRRRLEADLSARPERYACKPLSARSIDLALRVTVTERELASTATREAYESFWKSIGFEDSSALGPVLWVSEKTADFGALLFFLQGVDAARRAGASGT